MRISSYRFFARGRFHVYFLPDLRSAFFFLRFLDPRVSLLEQATLDHRFMLEVEKMKNKKKNSEPISTMHSYAQRAFNARSQRVMSRPSAFR